MKRFLCGVLAALMLVVLCACGKQETATVRLSEVTHSVFYAPQYVALEQGFFADEGLNIELTNGGGADKVMTAVLTGQADIGLAGPEACIYVYNQGKDDYPVVSGNCGAMISAVCAASCSAIHFCARAMAFVKRCTMSAWSWIYACEAK